MSILRNTGVMMMMGVVCGLMGCVASSGTEEDVGIAMLAGGTDHSNGLWPGVADMCWDDVLQAMSGPLVVGGAFSPNVPDSLLPGEKCEMAMQYAYMCAGAPGTSLPGPAGLYHGDGILTTATAWRNVSGLDNLQKQDVLTCMAALVNPEEGVDVCLSGSSVSSGNCYDHTVDEAVFKARLTRDSVQIDVWPIAPDALCPSSIIDNVLAHRLCNGDFNACHFQVRHDLAEACSVQNGAYDCGGPAIRTILTFDSFLMAYPPPLCSPPPQ